MVASIGRFLPGPRWIQAAALLCTLAAILAFVARGLGAVAAERTPPGVAVTSGFEEESLFSLWRAVHGQEVYSDPQRIPYAAAYFNWLFYASYAVPAKALTAGSGDAGLVSVGRRVTALWSVLGTITLVWLLGRVAAGNHILALAVGTAAALSPLIGWWAHTVRPDTAALTLEILALTVLLTGGFRPPAVLAGLLLFYCAWSFKPTFVFGLTATVLFLGWRRRWLAAALLVLGTVTLWAATFGLLGPAYRGAFLHTISQNRYYLASGVQTLCAMLLKTGPLWLLAAMTLLPTGGAPARSPLARDARLLGWLGVGVTLTLGFVATCKDGASSNYYFSLLPLLALVIASDFGRLSSSPVACLALGLAVVVQLAPVLGVKGTWRLTDARPEQELWAVWQHEPAPRYSAQSNLNLPWLGNDPAFVRAFNYYYDRADGLRFEAGGIGGLIERGYFRTLLLPAGTGDHYDEGDLRHYTRGETIQGLTVFRRQPEASLSGGAR